MKDMFLYKQLREYYILHFMKKLTAKAMLGFYALFNIKFSLYSW